MSDLKRISFPSSQSPAQIVDDERHCGIVLPTVEVCDATAVQQNYLSRQQQKNKSLK